VNLATNVDNKEILQVEEIDDFCRVGFIEQLTVPIQQNVLPRQPRNLGIREAGT